MLRRAGMQAATVAMVSSASEVAANVVGSRGSTSKSNPASKRVSAGDVL